MNRKQSLRNWSFAIFSLCFFNNTYAQPQLSYNNSNFSITAPPVNQVFKSKPYTRVFFETGTGEFFIYTTQNYNPSNQQVTFNQPWYSNTTSPIQPVAQLATFYDTMIKPHSVSRIYSTPTYGTNQSVQSKLNGGNIKITNSINNTIIPGDTMTLALTYKNTSGPAITNASCTTFNKSIMVLYYNGTGNTSLFNTIPTASGITYSFDGIPVNPIRMHNQEAIKDLNTFPNDVKNIVNANNTGGFSQTLVLTAPYLPNNGERNVFLSMVPVTNAFLTIDQVNSSASIKAVLIDYDSLNANYCYRVSSDTQVFSINRSSRDPNSITTTPSCLEGLTQNINLNIDYMIRFENIGAGNARDIKITVSIPEGLKFPVNGDNMFKCKIEGAEIMVGKEGPKSLLGEKKVRKCIYSLDQVNRKITFTISEANLSGTGNGVVKKSNSRRGDIRFKIPVDFSGSARCMFSVVSIVFDENLPVVDYSLIRSDCSKVKDCSLDKVVDPNTKGY